MKEIFVMIFGGALAYALYGVVVGTWRLILWATRRPPTRVKLPRALHIAGQVTSFLVFAFVAFVFWAIASGNVGPIG